MKAALEYAISLTARTDEDFVTAGPSNFSAGLTVDGKNTGDEHQVDLPAKRIRCSSDVDDVRCGEGRATTRRRSDINPVLGYAADLELKPGVVSGENTRWSWRYSPAPIIDSQPPFTPSQPKFNTTRYHRRRAAERNTGVSGPSTRRKQLQINSDPLLVAADGPPVGKSSNSGLPGSPPSPSLDLTKVLGEFAANCRATSAWAIGETTTQGVPKKSRPRGRRRWERALLDTKRSSEKTDTPGSVSAVVSSLNTTAVSEPCSDMGPMAATQQVRKGVVGLLTPNTQDTGSTEELTHKNDCHCGGQVTGSPADGSPAATTITDVREKKQYDVIGGRSSSSRMKSGAISPHRFVPRLSGDVIPWRGDTVDEPIIIGDDELVGVAGNTVQAEVVTLVENVDLDLSTEDRPLEAGAAQASVVNIPISGPDKEDITTQDKQILLHVISGGDKVNTNLGPVPSPDPSPGVRESTLPALVFTPHNTSLSATTVLPSVAPDLYLNPNLLPRPGLTFHTTVPYVTGPLSRFIHFHTTFSLLDLLTLICLKHTLTGHEQSRVSCFYMTCDESTLVIDLCDPDCEWDWEAWMGSVGKGGGVVCVNVMLGPNPVNRYISAPGHLIGS